MEFVDLRKTGKEKGGKDDVEGILGQGAVNWVVKGMAAGLLVGPGGEAEAAR